MNSNRDLKEITGLKGMAALIVLSSHYTITFFPAIWNAEYQLAHFPYLEKFIHRTPLYFFMNGSLMVNLFWCISGFLIGYSYYEKKNIEVLKKRIINRYCKLVIPITLSMLLAYVCQVNNAFFNDDVACWTRSEWLEGFYQFEPSLRMCIIDGIMGVFFWGTGKYNPVLWTIKAEVFGICMSALVLLLWGTADSKKKKRVYLFFSIIVNLFYQPLFAFLVGLLISDMYLEGIYITRLKAFFYVIISILLGSFLPIWKYIPSEIIISGEWGINIGEIFRTISAGTLLIIVLNSSILKKILKSPILVFFGNISMYLYMYHFVILCSFTCWCFYYMYSHTKMSYAYITLISSLAGIILTVFVSYFIKKIISGVSRELSNAVNNYL